MKKFIAAILCLLYVHIVSAQTDIHKIWIGEHHEYLDLRSKDEASFANPGIFVKNVYTISNDTLRLPKSFAASGSIVQAHTDENAYKIVALTANTLMLEMIANPTGIHQTLFSDKTQMVFREQSTVFKKSKAPFRFKKFYYATKEWYSGNSTKLQIDSVGNVYYSQGNHPAHDTTQFEYPKLGKLKPAQFAELVKILSTAELDSFPQTFGEHSGNMSVDIITVSFYYNNKHIIGKGTVRDFPYAHRNILALMKDIINNTSFKQLYTPVRIGE